MAVLLCGHIHGHIETSELAYPFLLIPVQRRSDQFLIRIIFSKRDRDILAGNLPLAEEYRKRLINSRNLISKPISPITAELAAEFRAHYRLRTPDALQAATALKAGCEAFLCNDSEPRRITELCVLVLTQQRVMKEHLRRTRSDLVPVMIQLSSVVM